MVIFPSNHHTKLLRLPVNDEDAVIPHILPGKLVDRIVPDLLNLLRQAGIDRGADRCSVGRELRIDESVSSFGNRTVEVDDVRERGLIPLMHHDLLGDDIRMLPIREESIAPEDVGDPPEARYECIMMIERIVSARVLLYDEEGEDL